ncbi:galactoside alpha-(1,2)-fucosyltransferase 1-like [Macrobrachium nipponense]|uniref:galactoside alpha-(1,2)-fucosyltransferase 1-like n=1 Tax=Macrobrachium nipponense TaxID=159736 RepID=UPI0030C81740
MRVKKKHQPLYAGLADDEEDNKAETKMPSLPVTAIIPRIWYRDPAQIWENLQLPVLTSEPLGRLGNVMGEYATLLGLGRVYGATVRLHPKMERKLKPTFPNISMELIPGEVAGEDEMCGGRRRRGVRCSPDDLSIPDDVVLSVYVSAVYCKGVLPNGALLGVIPLEYDPHLIGRIFEEKIRDSPGAGTMASLDVESLFTNVQKFREDNSKYLTGVTIGVHVRRTDYMHAMTLFKSVVPEHAYFKRATDYYREKHPGCRFLVSSDDLSFAKRSFGAYTDVVFTPGSAPAVDMALLASCNHSIITVGSYGFWCGYLCGGEVVYPDIAVMPSYTFQRTWYEYGQLKNFTPLPP